MVSDDLGFLLIFIVLPTVLIVSGLWMVLFIRRDLTSRTSVQRRPRLEAAVEAEAPADVRSRDEIWADALLEAEAPNAATPDAEADALPIVIATLPGPAASTAEPEPIAAIEPDSHDALSGADALSAALLNDPNNRPPSTARESEHHPELDAPVMRGNTEQIEPLDVSAELEAEAPATGDGSEYASASEPVALDVTIPSGSTAPLPEPDELERASDDDTALRGEADEAGDDQVGPDTAEGKRRRQPEARLTRSTEYVRRRGRGGRRVPPIVRPGLRDEDAVEGEDGGRDVPLGNHE